MAMSRDPYRRRPLAYQAGSPVLGAAIAISSICLAALALLMLASRCVTWVDPAAARHRCLERLDIRDLCD